MIDPYTTIYEKLWTILLDCPAIVAAVRPGNRIKSTATDGIAKRIIHQSGPPAGRPELEISPAPGGGMQLFATSTSSVGVQNFAFRVTTIDTKIDKTVFPLKWLFASVIAKAGQNLGLDRLVEKVLIIDAAEGDNTEISGENESRHGWSLVLVVSVQFRVPTFDLIAASN